MLCTPKNGILVAFSEQWPTVQRASIFFGSIHVCTTNVSDQVQRNLEGLNLTNKKVIMITPWRIWISVLYVGCRREFHVDGGNSRDSFYLDFTFLCLLRCDSLFLSKIKCVTLFSGPVPTSFSLSIYLNTVKGFRI